MTTNAVPMSQWPSQHRYTIPVPPGPDIVTLTIDGHEIQAPRGELLIKVAQQHGTYIPRFCWHERLKPVGMCRMCLVEVEGMRGLQISCATPVNDGMVVRTTSDSVTTAQDGILEFLLINHPLDCPVCDRGGECPLQDQTLAFGPGESRFVEEKRHFPKPIPISDLVLLDRERCIQCGRCTRFAAEVAGDPLIDFGGRGDTTEVITYLDEPFHSYFSGNTVQICPVGALTASEYRFRARPWDLESTETSCGACAVGCRGSLESTSNRLVRLLGVDAEPVNQGWLCDKGRYGLEWVHSDARLRVPMIRKAGELVESSWPAALDAAAAELRAVVDHHGPGAVGVLGGSRGTNEDAYVWARFAKGVLRTDHVDASARRRAAGRRRPRHAAGHDPRPRPGQSHRPPRRRPQRGGAGPGAAGPTRRRRRRRPAPRHQRPRPQPQPLRHQRAAAPPRPAGRRRPRRRRRARRARHLAPRPWRPSSTRSPTGTDPSS